ncbi:MAG: hypothetical protein A2W76_00840 [Gammaproteobacteria bacterium RIFCSPLOWO2_12_47_11]|nr:MAG: hypothetical protein A2W76_00840 [Gammaproteobacteria bacterium RIFCSPLOWO2_12_47_11]
MTAIQRHYRIKKTRVKPEYTVSEIIQREMTITHADFFRLLPKALADYQCKISDHAIEVKLTSGHIKIRLMPETTRRIGALELPVTNMTFHFENTVQDEMQDFFSKFNMAYQKGGG